MRCIEKYKGAYRGGPAVPDERDNGVVAARAASCRVDNDPDGLVLDEGEGLGGKHVLDVSFAENLLE